MQHLWVSQGCVQMLQTDVENTAQNIQNIYLTNIWLFTVVQYFKIVYTQNSLLLDAVGTSVT